VNRAPVADAGADDDHAAQHDDAHRRRATIAFLAFCPRRMVRRGNPAGVTFCPPSDLTTLRARPRAPTRCG
jgi:hypothetical protein